MDSALQVRSRGFKFTLKLGDTRNVLRRGDAVPLLFLLRPVDEADQQELLSFA